MTEKELRKLGRTELLELLLAERKENEQLQAQLAEAQQKLESRALTLAQTGSIAEAALQLNGVFDAAELACREYIENVRLLCRRQEAESREKAEALLAETRRECDAMRRQSERGALREGTEHEEENDKTDPDRRRAPV